MKREGEKMDRELSEGMGCHREDIGSQYRNDEGKEINANRMSVSG